eukprot:3934891-Rhodomonas_salina.1
MHASLAKYWAGDNSLHKFHADLVAAIQLAAANGLTQIRQFRERGDDGDWLIPITAMPKLEREALLIALEGAVPNLKRRAVAGLITAEEAQEAFSRRAQSPAEPGSVEEQDSYEEDPEPYFLLGLMEAKVGAKQCLLTNRHIAIPKAAAERQEAAAEKGQTLLTEWRQDPLRVQGETWLRTSQGVPAAMAPVDFKVYTGARTPLIHSGS